MSLLPPQKLKLMQEASKERHSAPQISATEIDAAPPEATIKDLLRNPQVKIRVKQPEITKHPRKKRSLPFVMGRNPIPDVPKKVHERPPAQYDNTHSTYGIYEELRNGKI